MYLYHAEICQIPPSSNDQIYPHQNYCHRHQVTHWEHSTYVLFLQKMFKLNLLVKKIKTIRQIQIEDTLQNNPLESSKLWGGWGKREKKEGM